MRVNGSEDSVTDKALCTSGMVQHMRVIGTSAAPTAMASSRRSKVKRMKASGPTTCSMARG